MDQSAILERLQAQQEKRKHISFEQFLSSYEDAIGDNIDDSEQEKLLLCPEPYTIIRRFDEYESNINKCCRLFSEIMYEDIFMSIQRYDGRKSKFWYHSARKALNVRPGCLNYNNRDLKPIVLDEEKKGHVLIIGQAGSGKSEMLHNIVFNLLREYSPNEVNLYLANMQFKDKIYSNNEQSQAEADMSEIVRKMQSMTNVCEDYNEVRSIVRLLSYAKLCMDDRIQMFSRLGVESLV